MNLALHQFKKDVRQFRLHLVLWFALLLLDLAVNLDWVGRMEFSPQHNWNSSSNAWTSALPVILWGWIGVLSALVVLTDSPARRDGFLATRPLPKTSLLLAKLLFVIGLIAAPWVLQETLHLALRSLPAWVIVRGTFERALITLPVALICASFAALWPSVARCARALGILAAIYLVISLLVSWLASLTNYNVPFEFKTFLNLHALVFALAVLTVWHSRRHRSTLARWTALTLALLISQVPASLVRRELFPLRPANPAQAESTLKSLGWEIPVADILLQADGSSSSKFSVTALAKNDSLPGGQTVEWSARNTTLGASSGGAFKGEVRKQHGRLFHATPWSSSYSYDDFAAWSPVFPPEILFRITSFGQSVYNTGNSFYLGRFNAPAKPEDNRQPLTLNAEVEGRVFHWKRIADLPLTKGAGSKDEFGSWQLLWPSSDVPGYLSIYLRREQVNLRTAGDSRCSKVDFGPMSRMAFMVYDPSNHVAWMPDSVILHSADRGEQTAYCRSVVTLGFNQRERLNLCLDNCRVVIFEKTWLGSVAAPLRTETFTLADKLRRPPVHSIMANNNPLPLSDFYSRLHALSRPALDAPRPEVSRYLLEFLQLVDSRRYLQNSDEPSTRQLADYVPHQLELFLDALAVTDGAGHDILLKAIQLGATEAQQPAVIGGLKKNPDLARIILERGWMEEARPEIYALTNSSESLPYSAVQAIAWFQDPATYPWLRKQFEAQPGVSLAALLEKLPGMEDAVKPVAIRQWRRDKLVLREPGHMMFGEPFRLAMRSGEATALQRVYQVLASPSARQMNTEWYLTSSLADGIDMRGLKPQNRHNSDDVLGWLRQHRPEEFVFNAARRQFVLKNP